MVSVITYSNNDPLLRQFYLWLHNTMCSEYLEAEWLGWKSIVLAHSCYVWVGHQNKYYWCSVEFDSGGSRIFERRVQVQVDYGNSTDCFITAGEWVYVEAAKLAPIRVKRRKISEFRTFEIASAGLQAPYSEHWSGGRRNCRICSTAPVGLIASFCSWLVKLTSYNFTVTMPTNFFIALHF